MIITTHPRGKSQTRKTMYNSTHHAPEQTASIHFRRRSASTHNRKDTWQQVTICSKRMISLSGRHDDMSYNVEQKRSVKWVAKEERKTGSCDRIGMYSSKAQCGGCRSSYVHKESHIASETKRCTKIATYFSHLAGARSNSCNTNEDSLQTYATNAEQRKTMAMAFIERPTGYN